MTTDMTFCLGHSCPAKATCKRYLTERQAYGIQAITFRHLSFAVFESKKGKDCIGYIPPDTEKDFAP